LKVPKEKKEKRKSWYGGRKGIISEKDTEISEKVENPSGKIWKSSRKGILSEK